MPSTYSTSLRLELMGAGEQAGNWGNTTNYNLGTLLEQAIAGVENVAISGTSYTLTTGSGVADQARNAVINLTGTLSANCDVIVPSVDKVYTVRNSTTGGFAVVVKTAAGSGVTVANGLTQSMYCDATNVVASGPAFNTATSAITANLTGNVTGNVTGTAANVTGIVAVANGGTGASTDSTARTNLGLGSMATQSANSVAITGGTVAVNAGTAALPGLAVSSDLDTGIYAPAANVLAVSLGGVEVARWEAGRYQIAGADGATLFRVSGASYALRLQSLAATGMNVEAVNPTEASFQPLLLGGSTVTIRTSGTARVTVPASGAVDVVGPLAIDGKNVGIQQGTEQATTSGVSIDFTSIPAGVRRVTVLFDRVSTNGTSPIMVQLGISTGIETTGYTVSGSYAGGGNFSGLGIYTTGFAFGLSNSVGAAQLYTGSLQLDLFNVTNNSFVGNGSITSNTSGFFTNFTSGRKALAGVLDRLRITTVNGTDTFDAGAVNIMWEF